MNTLKGSIANRMQIRLRKLRITDFEAAKKINVPVSRFRAWLNGVNTPNWYYRSEIAYFLGLRKDQVRKIAKIDRARNKSEKQEGVRLPGPSH